MIEHIISPYCDTLIVVQTDTFICKIGNCNTHTHTHTHTQIHSECNNRQPGHSWMYDMVYEPAPIASKSRLSSFWQRYTHGHMDC